MTFYNFLLAEEKKKTASINTQEQGGKGGLKGNLIFSGMDNEVESTSS